MYRRFLIAFAAAGAFTLATQPASAWWYGPGYGYGGRFMGGMLAGGMLGVAAGALAAQTVQPRYYYPVPQPYAVPACGAGTFIGRDGYCHPSYRR